MSLYAQKDGASEPKRDFSHFSDRLGHDKHHDRHAFDPAVLDQSAQKYQENIGQILCDVRMVQYMIRGLQGGEDS